MNIFTARNGIAIRVSDKEATLEWASMSDRWYYVGETVSNGVKPGFTSDSRLAIALREFFQAERDEALGRWRWPENPTYVVYPNPDEAFEKMFGPNLDLVILRELDGMTKGYVRDEDQGGPPMDHRAGHIAAARAYFEAHPERKPWSSAQVGEVWAVTIDGVERALLVDEEQFTDGNEGWYFAEPEITAARRIWPEDAS